MALLFNFAGFDRQHRPELAANPAYRASAEANLAVLAVLLFIVIPLSRRRDPGAVLRRQAPFLAYYSAIGIGLMLLLVPSVQRLTVNPGSPTYALAVVLFTILLSIGLGSRSTQAVVPVAAPRRAWQSIMGLGAIVLLHLAGLPWLLLATQAWLFWARALLVVTLLFPAGFLMGQPFPLGHKWANQHAGPPIPWLWAMNGPLPSWAPCWPASWP